MLLRKNFLPKIVLFKIERKTQNFRILRGILNQNVIFYVQNFLQNLLFKINFSFKTVLFKIFPFFKIMLSNNLYFFKTRSVVKVLIRNLTRCKNIYSEYETLQKF